MAWDNEFSEIDNKSCYCLSSSISKFFSPKSIASLKISILFLLSIFFSRSYSSL